jgi:hypothetical protein
MRMLRNLFLALLATSIFGFLGCGNSGPGSSAPRTPLGKADNTGSCKSPSGSDYCGGQSSGDCYCDELCEGYEDCCTDKVEVCDLVVEPTARTIEVILTDPFCDVCTSRDKSVLKARSPIVKKVIELLDNAEKSVQIAQFTFSVKEIEAAILAAHQREGVEVQMAMDMGQNRSGSVATRLKEAGVDVAFVQGREMGDSDGLLHTKFMLVDGKTLLSGSNNWSSTGTSFNEENTMVIQANSEDPLIRGFTCHFEAIRQSNMDTAGACSGDGFAFTPSSAPYKLIRDEIRSATSTVQVLMHHLTYDKLVKELVNAQKKPGVQVQLIVNLADREDYAGGRWDDLVNAGGQIRYKRSNTSAYQLMHNKLVIIDGKTLINGSGNWSGSGFFNNYENYIRYQEPEVVKVFSGLFARLWSWSLSASSVDGGLSPAQQLNAERKVYFGSLHAHFASEAGGQMLDDGKAQLKDAEGLPVAVDVGSSSRESARYAFEYARDRGRMDFMALTPHCSDLRPEDSANQANMTQGGYEELSQVAGLVTSESGGAFLALEGMEWSTNSTGNHVNILGSSAISKVERGRYDLLYGEFLPTQVNAGDEPIVMFNHAKTFRMNLDTLNGSYDQIFGVNLSEIPKSGERKQKFNDYGLDDFPPLNSVLSSWIAGEVLPDVLEVEQALGTLRVASAPYARLMEVTLNRGNEFGHEDGQNPSLVTDSETLEVSRRTKVHTDWDYYLARGYRMAPVASHDNHLANWGTGHSSRTGVVAASLTKDSLLGAIRQREVFASEDQNLELRFYADGRIPMGSRMETTESSMNTQLHLTDPDYDGEYQLTVYSGTIGSGAMALKGTSTVTGNGWHEVSVSLPSAGEHVVYLEVLQVGANRMAWTAPIWIVRH